MAILNLFNPSYTSSSQLKLKAARTYAVLLPFGKNTLPGSARTPFSNAVVRMADSESLLALRSSPLDRSSLNLYICLSLDHLRHCDRGGGEEWYNQRPQTKVVTGDKLDQKPITHQKNSPASGLTHSARPSKYRTIAAWKTSLFSL